MVSGGGVGGASAAPSARGTESDTVLVARPLGAGRSSCCAASALEVRSERATMTAGAQRMAAVGSGFSKNTTGPEAGGLRRSSTHARRTYSPPGIPGQFHYVLLVIGCWKW